MIDPLSCPSCSFANAPGAESCVKCGAVLAETPDRVPPGETLRDPDDLTLPPSPLLRAVLRGEPEAPVVTPSPAPTPLSTPTPTTPPTVTRATVEQLSPSVDQTALLRDLAERLHARKAETAPVRYAGFFVRVAAFLIDGAILGAFGMPLAAAGYFGIRAGMLAVGETSPIEADETFLTLLTVGWLTMATIYFTILHRTYGQTIGKWLLGLRVHTLELGEIGYVRALLRTLCYAASSSFLGFGFFLAALTPRKRAWHDFIVGTCVVRLTPEEASS